MILSTHSNRGPITKEDNRVHGSGKVHRWKTCTKPMGTVAKKSYTKEGQYEVHGCRSIHTCVRVFVKPNGD